MAFFFLSVALLVGILWWRKRLSEEETASMHEPMDSAEPSSPNEQFRAWVCAAAGEDRDLQEWLSSLSEQEVEALSNRVLTWMHSELHTTQAKETIEEQ